MNDEAQPAKAGFFSRVEKDAKEIRTDAERVIDAIEAWYAGHFRRAAVAGRAPISAEDKSELTKAVTAAIDKPEH